MNRNKPLTNTKGNVRELSSEDIAQMVTVSDLPKSLQDKVIQISKPLFETEKSSIVKLSHDEYVRLYETEKDLIPHEVVSATVDGATPVRAWREHLRLTQAEVAGRLGISQPSYAKQENSENLRPATITKIAGALGITEAQLDI